MSHSANVYSVLELRLLGISGVLGVQHLLELAHPMTDFQTVCLVEHQYCEDVDISIIFLIHVLLEISDSSPSSISSTDERAPFRLWTDRSDDSEPSEAEREPSAKTKKKKMRTNFSAYQLHELKRAYAASTYLTFAMEDVLTEQLGLTAKQIRVSFDPVHTSKRSWAKSIKKNSRESDRADFWCGTRDKLGEICRSWGGFGALDQFLRYVNLSIFVGFGSGHHQLFLSILRFIGGSASHYTPTFNFDFWVNFFLPPFFSLHRPGSKIVAANKDGRASYQASQIGQTSPASKAHQNLQQHARPPRASQTGLTARRASSTSLTARQASQTSLTSPRASWTSLTARRQLAFTPECTEQRNQDGVTSVASRRRQDFTVVAMGTTHTAVGSILGIRMCSPVTWSM